MKTILSATSIVAVLGAIASITVGADRGLANTTDIRSLSAQDIVIDPAMVEPANSAVVPAPIDSADTKITFVSQPQEALILPDAEDAVAQISNDDTDDKPLRTAATLQELVAIQPTEVTSDDMECLAGTVYFESKGESLAGQLAVAEVVINRKNSGRFASTICGVVYQPKQFSFVRGGKMPYIDKGSKHWRNAVAIAHIAMDNQWQSPVKGSLFFHANYVSPGWRLTRTGTIGNHIFYR